MCLRTLGGTLRKHEVTPAFRKGSSGVDPLWAELTRARRWHVGQKKQEREKRPDRAGSPPTRQNAGADAEFPGQVPCSKEVTERQRARRVRPCSLARARAFPGRAARLARGLGGRGASGRGRVRGVSSGAGVAEGGCRAEGSGPAAEGGEAESWKWSSALGLVPSQPFSVQPNSRLETGANQGCIGGLCLASANDRS